MGIIFFCMFVFLPCTYLVLLEYNCIIFSDVYKNVHRHGPVIYLVYFFLLSFVLVPHYSHCHWHFKSWCFKWKKKITYIWSEINTIICKDECFISILKRKEAKLFLNRWKLKHLAFLGSLTTTEFQCEFILKCLTCTQSCTGSTGTEGPSLYWFNWNLTNTFFNIEAWPVALNNPPKIWIVHGDIITSI